MEKKYFDELMASLEDAAAFARGDTSRGRVVEVSVPDPVPAYKAEDVRRTREALHLSQSALAYAMGVSPRNVAEWETGEVEPSGLVSRFLYLLDGDPSLVQRLV